MKKSLFALAALAAMGESASAGWARKSADSDDFRHESRDLGLLANIDSATINQNSFMRAEGNAVVAAGKIALAANPTAADVIRVCKIPAGSLISAILVANGALDTNGSPTLVLGIGYAPVVAGDGPTASPAYFGAAGDTAFRAANAGRIYANFDTISFEKDVYLTMTVGTASATFAAANIYATALGEARGVK